MARTSEQGTSTVTATTGMRISTSSWHESREMLFNTLKSHSDMS